MSGAVYRTFVPTVRGAFKRSEIGIIVFGTVLDVKGHVAYGWSCVPVKSEKRYCDSTKK